MRLWHISFLSAAAMLVSCDDLANLAPGGVLDEAAAVDSPDEMVRSAYAYMGDDWFDRPQNL